MDEQRHGFLERLFSEQRRGLAKYFRNRIRKSADVPDLVQEAFTRLTKVKSPEAIRSPVSYLYKVASNLLKEYRQHERRYVNLSAFDEKTVNKLLGELPSLERELEDSQVVSRLYSAIAGMPDIMIRTAMTLKYRYGLTYSEIAKVMRISTSLVKKLLAGGIALCLAHAGDL